MDVQRIISLVKETKGIITNREMAAHVKDNRNKRKNPRRITQTIIMNMMNNEILYILLPNYAAHEVVYLSQAIASDE